MNNFSFKERECQLNFSRLGTCFHLWTPENFEIIFTSDSDFKCGMGIVAIAAKLNPRVRILTFEIMNNHFHFVLVGSLADILEFFDTLKRLLVRRMNKQNRSIDWNGFTFHKRELTTLEDIRNVIVYDNRNGSVVNENYTPYSYPWGANKYYFNREAWKYADCVRSAMTVREMRELTSTHRADEIKGLDKVDGYALPISFCDIATGISIFRSEQHYLNLATKNVESFKAIADEIGESIFYSDNDLWAVVIKKCKEIHNATNPAQIPIKAKLEIARTMHYEYNASKKQIARMLKLPTETVASLGF